MNKDLIYTCVKLKDLMELNKLLENGYFIQDKNYDAKIDAVVYHIRKTLASWIFSKLGFNRPRKA